MQNTRGAYLALTLLGGYLIWRNRFAIQRQLESFGIRTPLLKGNLGETVRSIGSKVGGKLEHGADVIESQISRRAGNY